MSELKTELTNNNEQEIKEQDIPQEEKAFLTDTSTKTVWMKTKTGKDFCKMNFVEMLAKKTWPLFEKLKHGESMELLGFKFTYYDQTDQNGNKIQDGVGSVYRYPKGSGSGKPQFKPKYAKEVFKGLEGPTNTKLADPNAKWKVITTHYDPNEREVIFTLVREE